ncbi:MAG: hypothetical protein ACYC1Z_06870 [Georgenia sp.]
MSPADPEEGPADPAGGAAGLGGPDAAPGGGGRKRHHRVVALSAADRRRLAAGELTDPVEALHAGDAGPVRPSAEPQQGEGANDARLRRDVPPHWGKD